MGSEKVRKRKIRNLFLFVMVLKNTWYEHFLLFLLTTQRNLSWCLEQNKSFLLNKLQELLESSCFHWAVKNL